VPVGFDDPGRVHHFGPSPSRIVVVPNNPASPRDGGGTVGDA
jgi:hypothetical protein